MSAPRKNRVVGDFSAAATGDKTIHLKELRGKNVVIYFYPKDSTPGCTTEGRDFSALHTDFMEAPHRVVSGAAGPNDANSRL